MNVVSLFLTYRHSLDSNLSVSAIDYIVDGMIWSKYGSGTRKNPGVGLTLANLRRPLVLYTF